jgi:cytochrome c peroxidase
MHNGYFKSLKEVVHFYNTRDTLPHCAQGSPGEKVTCWPPPEDAHNMNTVIGKLGLTNAQENDLVAFLKILTDGYVSNARAAQAYSWLGSQASTCLYRAKRNNDLHKVKSCVIAQLRW